MSAVDVIYDALSKLLPALKKSDGTIEAKIIDVVGTYADSEAIERQNTLNVIQTALANQRITTREYYRRKAVAFQYGDTLQYDPVNFGGFYEKNDPEKQIVKQAYVIGSFPQFSLLVNGVDSNGHLRVLNADELASFITYFSAFQPLGMDINITSLPAAQITDPNIVVYVRSGVSAESIAKKINEAFTKSESVLRPTNLVTISEMEDLIQSVDGVSAVGWGSPTASETQIDGSIVTVSPNKGVFNLTNGSFTFATELTVANIKVIQ